MNEVYRVLIRKELRGAPAAVPPDAVSAVIVDYADRMIAEVTAAQHQALMAAGYAVEDLRTQPKIRVGMEALDALAPEAAPAMAADGPIAAAMAAPLEPEYYFVQFIGPIKPEWLDALRAAGLEPLVYYHDYSYLVYGNAAGLAQAAAQPFVHGFLPFRAEFTLPAGVRTALAGGEEVVEVWLAIFTTSDVAATLQVLQAMGVEIVEQEPPADFYQRFHVRVPAAQLDALAAMPAIYAVEPYQARRAEDEVAAQILAGNLNALRQPLAGYRTWLQTIGVDGSGVTIGINDDGIDGTHPAFAGRLNKIYQPVSSHGTMVAGQAGANYVVAVAPDTPEVLTDPGGFLYGVGVAPGADLLDVHTPQQCVTTHGIAGGDVGRILNNSWGLGEAAIMDYRSEERAWDLHVRNAAPPGQTPVPLIVCFSAGNSGARGLTRPKANKNSIVTGNFEVFRPAQFGADADDIDSRVLQSSIGNCADGRVRPDVVAPGEHTASAAVPPGDICHYLRFGGGTSAASPQTAGACALIVQWWRLRHVANGVAQTPSPAMVKALLINGAVDTRAGGPIPNMEQGWGRVNLMNIFHPAIPTIYLDQEILLRPDSPPVTLQIDVVDPTRPLKITLVWTDAAGVVNTGVPGNPALVNALGLRVAQNSHAWFGNNFAGGWSQTGGVQDAIQAVQPGRIVNNVQNVFIQGPNGRYEVRISPELIAGDCMNVTGAASSDFRQDFALVIQNARLAPGSSPTVTLVVEDGEPEETAAAHLVFLPLLATGGRLFTSPPAADVGGEETAIANALDLPSGDSLSRRAIILAGNQLGAISDQALGRLPKEQTVHTVATGLEVAAARLEAAAQAGWGAFWHVFQPARVALLYDAILAQESGMEGVRYAAGVLEQVAQVVRFPVVASDHKLFFLVHWDRPGVAIAVNLLRPDGTAIDPDHARRSSLVDYQATALGAAYVVTQPASRSGAWEGEWSVGLQAPAGAAATNFTVSLLVDSSLRLQLAWDKLSYTAGETMRLSAQVVDAGHVLTQGLRLLVRTETADQGATAVHEDEAAISFALGNGDQPDGYDTPHAATVRMHLQAGAAGVHDHTIGVEGTTASGAPFVRTRLVSRCVGSAPAAALAAMPPAIAETAEARGTPTTAGKLTELCYGGDGAFRGFRLQTATGDITYVPARAQLLSQVLIDALARQLRVAVVLEAEDGSALEVRLLPP